ncbi:TauD/TfdA dioxygenase family protein [Streptomyces hoynatensis]|uniref:TauD/TfdA family dioxygenase n=1 Tax=Streptomyces hoynatensis TaxID=1141874 RepID=A0A3A9Z972_9ACTN|nr:TauD/TfdA family dioxygenase [Streptomyces hoynatensis]RKN44911.1 TauD/TfdA family dioxygenase [Streptomyces hoynatensis]
MTETPTVTSGIEVRQLAGNIGAEITGVDTSVPLDSGTVGEIRRALLAHKVVFLRDQPLTYATQVAFARRLGDLVSGHPIFAAPAERPYLREIDSAKGTRANHWHTDLTFVDRPPAFLLLHGVVIPPVGGDTIWANSVAAYEGLPGELRELADRLRIVHSNDSDYTDATMAAGRDDYISRIFEAEHPAVHVHPETGERALLLGGFARRVPGLSPQASRDLIRVLQEHATTPEYTVRWSWREGDLAIWDNRATQHYAVYDYGTRHRRCERVSVAGGVTTGVDGRPGVMVRGDASSYYAGPA